jgi:predicted DsbA family dithiol-disulfide isomerase
MLCPTPSAPGAISASDADPNKSYAHVLAAGQEEGLDFAFDKIKRTPNTILAHRLIRFSARENRQEALVEALFQAYFMQGQDIGNAGTLAAIAAGAGLDDAKVTAFLAGSEDEDTIRQEDAFARQIGIQGVPCFIIDRQFAVSGAQPPEAFLEVFELAAKEKDSASAAPEVI